MKNWNKEEAIIALQKQADEIHRTTVLGRNSPDHMRWLANTLRILEEVFGANSRYYLTLHSFSWQMTGQMVVQTWDIERELEQRHSKAYQEQMKQAYGLLLAAKDHLESSSMEEVYEGKNTPDETSELFKIMNLSSSKLRKIIRSTPNTEKEIQDKYEDLLVGNDISYSREHPHIEYSSKQYVPDFSFKKLDLAVEIKLCKSNEKSLIAQINDDILAYKTVFKNLLFVIYDLAQIRDEDSFKSSFETNHEVVVQIIKH